MAVAIQHIHSTTERIQKGKGIVNMSRNKAENCRNEVKSYITREGMTMTEVVELLADVLGYDLVWVKRREVR